MANNQAVILVGIVALGGLGFYFMNKQSDTTGGGALTGGSGGGYVTPAAGGGTGGAGGSGGSGGSGGGTGGSGGGTGGGSSGGGGGVPAECDPAFNSDGTRKDASWRQLGGQLSLGTYNRWTCDINGLKGEVYIERAAYLPGETVNVAVLMKYYETSGDNDWWGYCGGTHVPASWYGNDELIKLGLAYYAEDESKVTIVSSSAYPQDPAASGAVEFLEQVAASGSLTETKIKNCGCRDIGTFDGGSSKDKWGIALYTFAAPLIPGAYKMKFKIKLTNPTGACNAHDTDTGQVPGFIVVPDTCSSLVQSSSAESVSKSNMFQPNLTLQSHHVW